jgi:hypothetical protein
MEENMTKRKEETTGCWEVWRQDDNGNKFVIASDLSKADADELCAKMTARGHKQMYWVQEQGKSKPTHQ